MSVAFIREENQILLRESPSVEDASPYDV